MGLFQVPPGLQEFTWDSKQRLIQMNAQRDRAESTRMNRSRTTVKEIKILDFQNTPLARISYTSTVPRSISCSEIHVTFLQCCMLNGRLKQEKSWISLTIHNSTCKLGFVEFKTYRDPPASWRRSQPPFDLHLLSKHFSGQ